MSVKNRSFYILIDLAAMAAAYVMTQLALYGSLPARMKWYGLTMVLEFIWYRICSSDMRSRWRRKALWKLFWTW